MNGTEALASSGFQNITQNTLKKIISRETLNIEEINVWRACLTWAEHECQRQGKQVRGPPFCVRFLPHTGIPAGIKIILALSIDRKRRLI